MFSSFSSFSAATVFCLLFVLAVIVHGVLRTWLARRQAAHVLSHRGAVPEQFAERISLAAHQKAADYTVAKTRLTQYSLVLELALLLAWTYGGGLTALSGFWQRMELPGLWYGVALIFSVLLISSLIDLPFSLYRQFVIEARFGFNRMTLALFFADLVKSALLGAAIGIPVLLVVLWLVDRMGSLWWLWAWGFWVAFNLLIMFVYPTWIAPLFNKFTPLEEGETRSRVEALLTRCGFRSDGLFVMDGSRRSAHGNAYFTGFGRNKRIVFFDTLLSRLKPNEIEAVLAHELGHFKHRHVIRRMVLTFVLALVFFALLDYLLHAPWFFAGLGVPPEKTGDTALAFILFFLALPILLFPATPLFNRLSRRDEFEADRYAAQQVGAEDLARALVALYEDNAATLTPDPGYSRFYDSHPPAAIRIAHLMAARA